MELQILLVKQVAMQMTLILRQENQDVMILQMMIQEMEMMIKEQQQLMRTTTVVLPLQAAAAATVRCGIGHRGARENRLLLLLRSLVKAVYSFFQNSCSDLGPAPLAALQ